MGLTEKDVDNVRDALAEWKPGRLPSEKSYEDSAYAYLNKSFARDKFERQYARGKTRADIYVSFKDGATVAIELKYAIKDRAEYHRLLGQIYEYVSEWSVEVLVVLCGDNDPALVKNIDGYVRFMKDNAGRKVRLIVVAE